MILKIKNIGIIKECEIQIDGITVVAGENCSGKSTIGKTLYSIYHSFHDISGIVYDQQAISIRRVLWSYMDFSFFIDEVIVSNIIKEFKGQSVEYIKNNIEKYFSPNKDENEARKNIDLEEISNRVYEALNVSEDEVLKLNFKRVISGEVGNNIGNVNYPSEKSSISLNIKGKDVVNISLGDKIEDFEYVNLYKDAIYIDDPFVLDYIQNNNELALFSENHKRSLIRLVRGNSIDIIDEYITTQKLDKIISKISLVCNGKLVNKEGRWMYHSENNKKDLDLNSVSTGLKNFVILRTLLEKGIINTNGLVILDEPEINLHPKWQLVLAEILVLLHKEFGLNILLNTHSPYFINSIEVFSKKYEVTEKCNYYLAFIEGNEAMVEKVNQDIEKIYSLLAEPLQELEGIAND